jgi:hypothetical protein
MRPKVPDPLLRTAPSSGGSVAERVLLLTTTMRCNVSLSGIVMGLSHAGGWPTFAALVLQNGGDSCGRRRFFILLTVSSTWIT